VTAAGSLRWLLVAAALLALLVGGPASAAAPDPDAQPAQESTADSDVAPAAEATPAADPLQPSIDVPLGPYGMPFIDVGGPPTPAFVGSGTDALIRAPKLRNGNAPTLYERFGSQGYALDAGSDPLGGNGSLNSVAATIFATAMWLAQAVIATVQWSFNLAVFDVLGDAVTPLVDAVKGVVYNPFVSTMIVLAGLWLIWHGLIRRHSTVALQGAVWTVAALAVGAAFLAAPTTMLQGSSELGTAVSRSALSAVSVADPRTGPADGTTTAATYRGNRADAQLRLSADRFWRVFIHQPWTVMQFGDTESGERFAERLLEARTISPDEYTQVRGDEDALAALVERKAADHAALSEEIVAEPRSAEWFRGRRSVERVGLASLTLAGVAVGGVLLLIVAAAIVLAQVAVALLVMVAPIALLLGIHPGTGRVIAVRWAQLAVGLLLKRVALGVLLAIVLVVNGIVLDATYPAGWFVTMGLQTLLVAAVVVYRRPFLRLVGPTTVPVLHRSSFVRTAPVAAAPTPSASPGPVTAMTHTLGSRSGGQRRRQSNALQHAVVRPHLPATRPPHEPDMTPPAEHIGPPRRRAGTVRGRRAPAGGTAVGDVEEGGR
jgi:hypothetical protein